MDAKDHIGSPIDLASIRMRGDKAKKTVEASHGGEGGGDLFSGEGADGREDTHIHTAPVVQQVAYCYLQLLGLGGEGWRRKFRPSRGLGGPGSKGGRDVERRGRGRTDPVGAKAGKEGGDIAWVRERESFEGAVVVHLEAKEFGGYTVGFGVVKEGKS